MLNLPKLNVELLTTLVKWAGQDVAGLTEYFAKLGFPEWDQESWGRQVLNGACQTACCIAGNAAIQAGYVLSYHSNQFYPHSDPTRYAEHCGLPIPDGVDEEGKPKFEPDPEGLRYIPTVAQEVLGLTREEANELFDGDNSLGDVVFIARAIADSRNIVLDLPEALKDEPLDRLEDDYEEDPGKYNREVLLDVGDDA